MPDFSDAASLWQAVLGRLQVEMPREQFQTFLRPCVGQGWEDGCLVVAAASAFAVSWLELPLHRAMAEEALGKALGRAASIRYRALPELAASASSASASAETPGAASASASERVAVLRTSAPPASARRAPVPDDYDLGRGRRGGADGAGAGGYDWAAVNAATGNPRYTFDNFVVGVSNQLAYYAACAAADGIGAGNGNGISNGAGGDGNGIGAGNGNGISNGVGGDGAAGAAAGVSASPSATATATVSAAATGYNPLAIYSGPGLGKTHLLHAIGNCARRQGRAVLYVTSEQFTNEFISAINRRAMREFRDRYRSLDLLLLDDVQFLAGKEQTQESLFHTFNDLHQAGAQIVLTSDRPPQSIAPLEERLRSRFQWGLMADIQPPSVELRRAMLEAWAQERGVAVPAAALEVIARRVKQNVRQLQGAFNRALAMAQLLNAPLTPESVSEQLDAIAGPNARSGLTADAVLRAAAQEFGIGAEQILGRGRTAAVAQARQVVMYLLTEELGMSPTETGRFLSGRNHSTALHGASRIRAALPEDARLRQAVGRIKGALLD